eukprot:m.308763 g.308763  ORF g.308763 m.308763 type:complete len:449 (+) comp44711_c0_seq1:82-1428(+)
MSSKRLPSSEYLLGEADEGTTAININRPLAAKRDCVTFTLTTTRQVQIPLTAANIVLSILNVICQVGMTVSLPLFTTALGTHKACGEYGKAIAGPYFVLFFTALWFPVVFFAWVIIAKLMNRNFSLKLTCPMRFVVLLGFMNSLNGVLLVYASPSDRTPQYLQPILSASVIPFTVILRYIILRKGISGGRLVCTFIVLVSLIICMEPTIFKLGQGSQTTANRTAGTVIWPIIFCIGFVPLAIINVIQEREVKKGRTDEPETTQGREVHTLLFQAWLQLFNFFFLAAMFFLDFIPKFGASSNFSEFSQNMRWGWQCEFGQAPNMTCLSTDSNPYDPIGPDPHCSIIIGRTWIFTLFYCLSNLISLMLIKYAEGAVYLVIVNALITPVGTFFLTLFQLDGNTGKFFWKPEVDVATWYAIAGVAMMVPAVIGYNFLGQREKKERERKRNET